MDDFLQYCNQLSTLDTTAQNDLLRNVTTKTFDKGEYLLKQDKVCKHLFFINKGLVKLVSINDGKEFIMRFFAEGVLFSAFDSYLTQTPSKFMITALENTTVILVTYNTMETLRKKHHCIETLFGNLLSIATTKMTRRINEMLEENATERYNKFVKENNAIIQRISLGDISNYLGIAQQSLSRIRNGK